MANVLSEKSKKAVQREYRLRFTNIALTFMSLVLIVALLIFVSALLLLSSQERTLSNQVGSLSDTDIAVGSESDLVLTQTAEKITLQSSQLDLTEPLTAVIGPAPAGVSLLTFSLRREIAESDPEDSSDETMNNNDIVTVVVSGVAQTRAQLLEFQDRLERSSEFTSVDLPVSHLANDRDVQFSLTITAPVPNDATAR